MRREYDNERELYEDYEFLTLVHLSYLKLYEDTMRISD